MSSLPSVPFPVYSRQQYGMTRIYAADPAQANALSILTNGARTLETRHLMALESLGFTIVAQPSPETLAAQIRFGIPSHPNTSR